MSTSIHPQLKGSDRVREDCGNCGGTGVYDAPSRVTWDIKGKGETTWCFACQGAGFTMVLVSSVRARARRQEKALAEAEARAEAAAARNAEREAQAAAEAAVREAEQAAKVAASAHLGTVGEKLTVTASIEKRFAFEGMYGVSYLWILRTSEGQVVTMYSAAQVMFDWEDAEGVREVTATVKAHTERDGIKQTQVVRPKLAVA